MIELELLGTSSDGESLVLTDAQGERYSVFPMSSAARRAVIVREWSWHPLVPRSLLVTFRLSCALARPRQRLRRSTAWRSVRLSVLRLPCRPRRIMR